MKEDQKKVNVSGIKARLFSKLMKLSDEKIMKVYAALFDERKFPRKKFHIPVDYDTYDESYRDTITDISAGGVFIQTNEPLDVGEEVSLFFSVKGPRSPFNITGRVVRRPPRGIGVEFVEIIPQQQAALTSMLKIDPSVAKV